MKLYYQGELVRECPIGTGLGSPRVDEIRLNKDDFEALLAHGSETRMEKTQFIIELLYMRFPP